MRAVVQRVKNSRVEVDGKITGEIGPGLMILLGVEEGDTEKDAVYMADKISGLRIFQDPDGKMNLSLLDTKGEALAVSQFTLAGDCRKGRRPSFVNAAGPELAEGLYEKFKDRLRTMGITVAQGIFGAMMDVHLVNDGPVTILVDSRRQF